jgi:hypothetical protein
MSWNRQRRDRDHPPRDPFASGTIYSLDYWYREVEQPDTVSYLSERLGGMVEQPQSPKSFSWLHDPSLGRTAKPLAPSERLPISTLTLATVCLIAA